MKQNGKKQKFTVGMKKKLVVMFIIILLVFVGLCAKLVLINKDKGAEYKKQVLSQQQYDSKTLPFRRGEITDKKGTILAVSEKVYSVILDAKQLLSSKENVDPTVKALVANFGLKESDLKQYLNDNPSSQYYVLKKKLPYDQIAKFKEMQTPGTDSYNDKIQGVWFEESYVRNYPNGSLACDLIGFTTSDNNGQYGLEEYYNNTLSGTPGREYGYLDDDSNLERTTIAAEDGDSLVTSIDGNIQTIVEKYLQKFNDEHKDGAHPGNGANNVGCVVMDIHTGNILAMASYPKYDLNDTKNIQNLIGMRMMDDKGNKVEITDTEPGYITADNVSTLKGDQLYQNYNALWKNFCISDTYEPGSVAKPFTVAAGLESGSITGNEVYQCNGFLHVGDYDIKCHNVYGHGAVSVERGIEVSCNVAMMYVAQATGVQNFTKFQQIFGFGLKTNIDLAGEARTQGLTYTAENMGPTELATCSFGQGFNVSMVEMISAFCSLVNGGYYYEPHVVSKIVSPSGATVQNIEPRILRQTVSQTTSDKIIEFCDQVVAGPEGTGKTARPAGYMIGGKTGTAETVPRNKKDYVVSFMGYAPAKDPQIAIYVVVDRPNVIIQDDAKFATGIVRNILTEGMPYLNFPMTETLSDEEKAELEQLKKESVTTAAVASSGDSSDASSSASSDSSASSASSATSDAAAAGTGNQVWKTFDVDPATGYYVDPNTGNLIDPETGDVVNGSVMSGIDDSADAATGSAAGSATSK